jgi:Fe2+ transport system protein B
MSDRVNLSPLHWGPKTWFFLESAAIAYPIDPTEDEKTSAKNLILSLKDLLPCLSCRLNYASYLDENIKCLDDVVKNRETFLLFIVDVHNEVRVRNNQEPRSVEDVFNYYQKQYSKNPTKDYENFESKIKSKDEIIKSMNIEQENQKKITENFASEMLFHFNPITLLIGIMIGLIIYKFYNEYSSTDEARTTN